MATESGYCIKDSAGNLSGFRRTRGEIEAAVVGTYYSPRGLAEDPAYRALFDKELSEGLEHRGLTIVPCSRTLIEIETPAKEI
jgi:hypothetical protein